MDGPSEDPSPPTEEWPLPDPEPSDDPSAYPPDWSTTTTTSTTTFPLLPPQKETEPPPTPPAQIVRLQIPQWIGHRGSFDSANVELFLIASFSILTLIMLAGLCFMCCYFPWKRIKDDRKYRELESRLRKKRDKKLKEGELQLPYPYRQGGFWDANNDNTEKRHAKKATAQDMEIGVTAETVAAAVRIIMEDGGLSDEPVSSASKADSQIIIVERGGRQPIPKLYKDEDTSERRRSQSPKVRHTQEPSTTLAAVSKKPPSKPAKR